MSGNRHHYNRITTALVTLQYLTPLLLTLTSQHLNLLLHTCQCGQVVGNGQIEFAEWHRGSLCLLTHIALAHAGIRINSSKNTRAHFINAMACIFITKSGSLFRFADSGFSENLPFWHSWCRRLAFCAAAGLHMDLCLRKSPETLDKLSIEIFRIFYKIVNILLLTRGRTLWWSATQSYFQLVDNDSNLKAKIVDIITALPLFNDPRHV